MSASLTAASWYLRHQCLQLRVCAGQSSEGHLNLWTCNRCPSGPTTAVHASGASQGSSRYALVEALRVLPEHHAVWCHGSHPNGTPTAVHASGAPHGN